MSRRAFYSHPFVVQASACPRSHPQLLVRPPETDRYSQQDAFAGKDNEYGIVTIVHVGSPFGWGLFCVFIDQATFRSSSAIFPPF